MKTEELQRRANKKAFLENMRPGCTAEYTDCFREAWEIHVVYDAAFLAGAKFHEDALEKADELVEASKGIVEWMKGFQYHKKFPAFVAAIEAYLAARKGE